MEEDRKATRAGGSVDVKEEEVEGDETQGAAGKREDPRKKKNRRKKKTPTEDNVILIRFLAFRVGEQCVVA